MRLWIRILLILISIIFIAAGALNDGPTGWFWGGIFIWLLYFALPYNWKIKVTLVIVVFSIMYGVSRYKYQSSWIYPVIGQKVTLNEDIPFKNYDVNHYWSYYYDSVDDREIQSVRFIPKGEILSVKRIMMCGEMYSHHCFVMSNSNYEVAVDDTDLWRAFGSEELTSNKNYCTKVDWLYCNNTRDKKWYESMAMRTPFRQLSYLMYYPISPLLLYSWIEYKLSS